MLRVSQWYNLAEGLSPEFKRVCRLGANLQKKYNRISKSLNEGVFYPGELREMLSDRLVLITELLHIIRDQSGDDEKMEHLVADIESQFHMLDVERNKLVAALQAKNYGQVELVLLDTDKLVRSYVYQPMMSAKMKFHSAFKQNVIDSILKRRGISAKLERPVTATKKSRFKTADTVDL